MENEKRIKQLEDDLKQMKDNFNAMQAEKDKLWRELSETRMSLNKEENMKERLLKIIENLSEN